MWKNLLWYSDTAAEGPTDKISLLIYFFFKDILWNLFFFSFTKFRIYLTMSFFEPAFSSVSNKQSVDA